ncbi:uncharacterized protein [Clytia hemisphaerica]|uniref:uncharacterized protein n=1 Tax=Clytia hemisphaerica TaxID=252671 RepID=UPI0034D4A571
MEEYTITQRKKQRSSSLTSSAPSNIQSHEKDASTHIEGNIWFFDSTNTDQTDNNNQEEGMLSPPITNGKSSPFTKNQMDFINLLLNDQKEEMTNEINKLKNELKTKDKQIFRLEKDLIDIQQYVCRNNIEIHGIPDTVEQKDLEKKVVEVCSALNVHVKKQDIEACHRLADKTKGNTPKKTIVRFTNRKFCDDLHRNKKMLKDGNNKNIRRKFHNMGLDNSKTFINKQSLSLYNKFLWGKCKQLHTAQLIDRFWVFNGHIFINDNPNESKGTKISHLNELKESFPGF